jgi:integration host factor subunit alpha
MQKEAPPMALTKSEIISKVSNEIGLTNKESIGAVDNIIEIIKSTLESGEDVLFSGFGKFSILEKNVRKGRNPATGNGMMLPARRVVNFKCSGKLRDRINGKE